MTVGCRNWLISNVKHESLTLNKDTIVTVIPFRKNVTMADNLLETIRQGDLDSLRNSTDLIKCIVYEAASFPKEFKWAGLGEHVLDVFEGEIACEVSSLNFSSCKKSANRSSLTLT